MFNKIIKKINKTEFNKDFLKEILNRKNYNDLKDSP